ncbi:MAG: hypothetical protein JJ975_05510 [Bacteroidia bacterium]|nr:hypothetical protein [Bacteroidia bacterium]
MKLKNVFLVITLLSLFGFLHKEGPKPNVAVEKAYLNGLDELLGKLDSFHSEVDEKSLSLSFYQDVRGSFKAIEFLLAQIDHEFYLKYVNGAPLPKLEKNVPDLRVLDPQGFQVIDELVIETPNADFESILVYTNKLEAALQQSRKLHREVRFSNELILTAVQHQMLRIYALGVTGFDTPGSLLGLEDAIASLESMASYIEQCEALQAEKVSISLLRAADYISHHNDFDGFDRLTFYKDYWQPAYSQIIVLYEKNQVRRADEVNPFPIEVRYSEPHLFTTNFFNKQAFIDFPESMATEATVNLGKRLFFDQGLSSTGTMSCGSCHNPKLGFSDGKAKSDASNGYTSVMRNSPGLVNAIYTKGFFYDLRAPKLSQQFEHVIFSEDEFNTSLIDILDKLSGSDYIKAFKKCFPGHTSNPVNPYTFKVALSAYVSSLTSYNSSFDRFMRGETNELSDSVKNGYNLFMGKAACGTCHFAPSFAGLVPPYFNDSETEVLGVPETKDYQQMNLDPGRYSDKRPKERISFYKNSFKTTTVRNVSKTQPYMHNGVFDSLEEVVEFYNHGGGAGHGFDVPHQTLAADSLHLTEPETRFLIHFMKSLEEDVY